MLSNKLLLSLFITAFMYCSIGYSGVYKWTDANGKIHFSDKPHKDAAQITIKTAKPSGLGTSNRQLKRQKELLLKYQNDRQSRESKQRKTKKRNAVIERQCKRLRDLILSYEEVDYLYTRNEDGKKKHLSGARKKKETAKLKNEYNEKCT